jgi:hypothetical protein
VATKTASVVFDVVSWNEPIEGTVPAQWNHMSAYRGEVVELPAKEFTRLEALGAIVAGADVAEALEAWDLSAGPAAPGVEGDAELLALSDADLIAYTNQHPAERERVYLLETTGRGRKKARVDIVRAAGYDPETGTKLTEV